MTTKLPEKFDLVSDYKPTGDQPKAINKLTKGVKAGDKAQILLGATGTGKTFTMANVIKNVNKPTLVLAPNKTLAGQLYNEFKEFFPNNAVEYFVSYYDFYQPEAYVPSSDTYIEKDASVNDEIDQLRHGATSALLERNDVIVVASVSSIFGLGSPKEYHDHTVSLTVGKEVNRDALLRALVNIQYDRNDIDFQRGRFRVRGDVVEIFPASKHERAYRIEFFGDEIDRIREINPLTGEVTGEQKQVTLFPATHFLTNDETMKRALPEIESDMEKQVQKFQQAGKLLEAQRIQQRTTYDMEMMKEMGYTSGIENYSRYLERRKPGEPPYTLLDFFPKDFLIIADESHQTMPQIRGMFKGDKARKKQLIDYGFRLESAIDNRPLTLPEFEKHVNQIIYMSATPGPYEHEKTKEITQQVIRPTGLLDPKVEVRPSMGQMDDLLAEINQRVKNHERTFVTTLTKKMAEDLTDYLKDLGIKVKYLHSDIKTLERTKIIRDLRLGKFDVLIGINLLREGIDVPETSLVAILDADKEGFLRNERSLIQTIGRAARNEHGKVILYADKVTESMKKAMAETSRRRDIQIKYNKDHHITPRTIKKEIRQNISIGADDRDEKDKNNQESSKIKKEFINMNVKKQREIINELEEKMQRASQRLAFEQAANLRDQISKLKKDMKK